MLQVNLAITRLYKKWTLIYRFDFNMIIQLLVF